MLCIFHSFHIYSHEQYVHNAHQHHEYIKWLIEFPQASHENCVHTLFCRIILMLSLIKYPIMK